MDLLGQPTYLDTDLLIIGGGTAGPMAAIKAARKNPQLRITVVEKATIRRGGSICRGMDAFNNVTIPGVATVDEYVDSISILTEGVLDRKLNRIVAENNFLVLKELEEWGAAHFPKDDKGRYIVSGFHPRGKFMVEMRGDIKPAFERMLKEHGIQCLERTIATRILTSNGRCTGATLLNIRTGEFTVCRSKAVIVCAGGQGRFGIPDTGYLFGTFDCPYNAGDGYSLLYHAGAALVTMEYMECAPMIKDFEGPGHSTFVRHGAYLINALGERYLTRYAPELMERAPARIREAAMHMEIMAGRGPIYYDLRHLSEQSIRLIEEGIFQAERPTEKEFFSLKGIDLQNNPVELTLSGPYICGGHAPSGALIDENGQTTIQNLFAAGDVASVGWGFVGAAWVFGTIAGEYVATNIDNLPPSEIATSQAEEEYRRLLGHLNRRDGLDPSEFEFKVRRIIRPYLSSPKSQKKLEITLNYVEQFRQAMDALYATDFHQLMKVTEVSAIVDTIEMAARASLERKESRWGYAHRRVDYPETDAEWGNKFVVIEKNVVTQGMTVGTKPVPNN
jgi:succinate dehydrogenase/fumarate reductase flavoprotein subunit